MPNGTATTPGASMASRQDNQGKGGVGLLLLLGAGAAASAYLLTRPKSNCTILGATYANAVIQDTDSGAYYVTDPNSSIYGPYTSDEVAACLASGQKLYQASSDVINACGISGHPSPCFGLSPTPPTPTPPTPTPPTPTPTWAAWWPTASDTDRIAVAVWWACLQRAPGTAPQPGQPLPSNSDPALAYYNGGCGADSSWFDAGTDGNIACAAFRYITDRGCEFWSAFGGTTNAQGDICEPVGYSCASLLSAAGSRLLGHPWSPDSGDLSRCQSGQTYDFGAQPISSAVAGVVVVACSLEFTLHCQAIAAAASPPFAG